MTQNSIWLTLAAALLLTAGAASAQQAGPAHHGAADGGMSMPAGSGQSPSTKAFMAGMERMHRDMATYTGDTDADFLRHMIPHHQGAIDMAEVELKYGHDPKVKRLARQIIAAQRREIATMKAWLARRGQ